MNSQPHDLRRAGALKVLLIVLGVIFGGFILICAGCLTFAYFKGKPLVAEGFRQVAAIPLDSDQLSQDQRDRLNANIDRVMNGVKTNQISIVQLGTIIGELSSSSYPDLAVIEVARGRVAALLGQDDKRWKEASRVIDRFARGVSEGRINRDRIDHVLNSVSEVDPSNGRRAKQSLTEVEAEDFLEAASKEVERAGVPDEPYSVDLAGELGKIIDRGLAGGGTTSAPTESRRPKTVPPRVKPKASETRRGE
jgi:hypothetical protein